MGLIAYLKGITSNSFAIGDKTNGNKRIIANIAAEAKPEIRYNYYLAKWQFTNNGIDWYDLGAVTPVTETYRYMLEDGAYLLAENGDSLTVEA
jgi:hypothetical protein